MHTKYLDHSFGCIFPVGSTPPMLVMCFASAPKIYLSFDPSTLSCRRVVEAQGIAAPGRPGPKNSLAGPGAAILWPLSLLIPSSPQLTPRASHAPRFPQKGILLPGFNHA